MRTRAVIRETYWNGKPRLTSRSALKKPCEGPGSLCRSLAAPVSPSRTVCVITESAKCRARMARVKLAIATTALLLTMTARGLEPETLYSFQVGPWAPTGNLVEGPDGNFYGTSIWGGSFVNFGTIFRVTTNGALTLVASFSSTNGQSPNGLVLGEDGNFYGTISGGGNARLGSVFRATTNELLTTLASFNGPNGASPRADLALGGDGNYYGTTERGGESGLGTVFRITPQGMLTTLASFDSSSGANPRCTLSLGNDGNFYGTTSLGKNGDTTSDGTVFKITTNGILTTLAWFSGTNGTGPTARLVLGPDGSFYGTTSGGGKDGYGAFFKVTPQGELTLLASFTLAIGSGTKSELVLGSDGSLYGTAANGGSAGYGTVFKMTPDGVLNRLNSFTAANGSPNGLVLARDGSLYGTASGGGSLQFGTMFKVTTNGVLTRLLSFNPRPDGSGPAGELLPGSDGTLYGTTRGGGIADVGTVFSLGTNRVLTTLGSFTGVNGAGPVGGLVSGNDGRFYGTTTYGGSAEAGTVFRVETNGSLTRLVSFSGANGFYSPMAPLVLGDDGNFYGTTAYGAVFRVTPTGTLTKLASINGVDGWGPGYGLVRGLDGSLYGTTTPDLGNVKGKVFRVTTNGTLTSLALFNGINGSAPRAGLALGHDGNFYGTTSEGGTGGGTVFRVGTNGDLATMAWFGGDNGWSPVARLLPGTDGSFFGTTRTGGSSGYGTVFQVRTNGALVTLVTFNQANGAYPLAGLVSGGDGHLYGATSEGGPGGGGTVFKLKLPDGVPVVIEQPQPVTVYAGRTVTFSVMAGYVGPFTYQWMLNGTNVIAGATDSSYTLANVQLNDQGSYSCVITGPSGSSTSSNAVFSVLTLAPVGYEAVVLADHPIAYWRFDEPEGSVVAYDHVGGHNGSYNNVSLGLPGHNLFEQDTAAGFGPATNSFVGDIEGIDFSSTGPSGVFSLECWVNGASQPWHDAGIVTMRTGIGGEQFDLGSAEGNGGAYRFLVVNGTGNAFAAEGFPPARPNQTWQHLVAVYDGAAMRLRLYVNGIQVGASVVSLYGLSSSPHRFAIGSRRPLTPAESCDCNFNGMIDEVAIYDYALSADQVLAHYVSGTTGLTIRSTGDRLQLTWPGGILQWAPEPAGPYADITNVSSADLLVPSNTRTFYRVKIR